MGESRVGKLEWESQALNNRKRSVKHSLKTFNQRVAKWSWRVKPGLHKTKKVLICRQGIVVTIFILLIISSIENPYKGKDLNKTFSCLNNKVLWKTLAWTFMAKSTQCDMRPLAIPELNPTHFSNNNYFLI